MDSPAPTTARPPLVGLRALQALAAVLLLLRLAWSVFAYPLGDEAYYWIWGQHPDISYFDHPPLNAWLLGLSSLLFGWSNFAIRFPALLTTAGSIAIFWLWSRRVEESDREQWFWLAVVSYFATPMIGIFSGMVFSDHLLIFLCLCALYAFSRLFESWDAGRPAGRYLFAAALVLGLAALAKYNAVFVGIAVMLHILLAPRRYPLLARWQLYAAAALCLLVLSPLLWWNATHGFASFAFHTAERYGDILANASLERFGYFALFALAYLGPVLVIALIRMLFARRRQGAAGHGRDLGRLTFIGSTTVFGLLGANGALPYWNIVAYAALFPHVVNWIGARIQLIVHLGYGLLVAMIFVTNYAVLPVAYFVGGSDTESSFSFGWDTIAARVAESEAQHEHDFLAASRYPIAAQLSIVRGRDDVTSLSARVDQYDLWFDPAAHAGQTALIFVDAYGLDPETIATFASVEEVDRFTVERFGRALNTYVIYLAKGYGEGPAGLPQPF